MGEITGGGLTEERRRRLLEELKGLFGPAFGPGVEAYGRSFAERISEDEGFRAEARDRFERGRALGGFPELSALLSGKTPEEQREFFETGWTCVALPPSGPSEDPWDRASWCGNREGLYSGLAFGFSDFRVFAREWLEELLRVGYYGMEESLGLPLKQQADSLSPVPESLPIYGHAYPVRLEGSRQTIWLNLDGPRSREGQYREILVSEEPLRTDGAIFAALAMLEGKPLDVGLLREALPEILPLRGESVWDRWTEALSESRGGHREDLPEILGKLRYHQTLDYVLMLLRYHRPGFDDASRDERAALLADSCAYLNESLEGMRRFMAYVEGLTHHEIGKRLGVPPPADFSYKGDHPTVRKMVGRGRKAFEIGLGKEGWQSQIEAMKEESRRRSSLSEVERDAEDAAEALGIPHEEALKLVEEERAKARERREEPGIA